MNRGRWLVLIFVVVAAATAAFAFRDKVPGLDESEVRHIVFLLLALILVGGGVAAGTRSQYGLGKAARDVALWVLILIGALGLYVIKDDLGAAMNLGAPRQVASGEDVELRRADDGHFYVSATVNEAPVSMMVDTGATRVVLSRADAQRLGIDVTDLAYIVTVSTGGGEIRAAPKLLRSIKIGGIEVNDVAALIPEREAGGSILGMSFLSRLDGYEVRGNRLILHP